MKITVKGKIVEIGEVLHLKSTTMQLVIVDTTTNEKYPETCAFSLWNKKIDEFNKALSDYIEADCDIRSRESFGKWYTEISCYKWK
ncbi:hypothetical protein FACS1894153_4510 [Bacteroidia bacterium]|nr:hypothetical protein FACS1894153_4510 [Bacteroidia bacterium]